ncbi:MAG: hypothetical protein ACRCU5_11240 [Rhizobiaceae bacterium]
MIALVGLFVTLLLAGLALPIVVALYKLMVPRIRISLPLCLLVGTSIVAPIAFQFERLQLSLLYTFEGFMAGGFFYWFDQIAPARKAQKAAKQN